MKRLITLTKILRLATVSFLSALLLSSGALAVDNGGIGGKPANPRADNPRSESIFVYELEPGSRIEDAVKVINNTDQDKTVLVYAVDSQVSSDGAFACAQKADSPVSVGTWITLAKSEVQLGPNGSEDVSFTVDVPETASAGESNGCIVIQDSGQTPSPQGNGVTLSFRSAIRVAVTVPGEITKELDFTGPVAYKLKDELVQLTVGLKNNGNVSLDTDISANITTVFGSNVRTTGGTFPVLANSEGVFNFEVEKPFWGGLYAVDADATYSSGLDESLGESGDKNTIKSSRRWVFVAPQPLALAIEAAILIVVLALAGLLTFRRLKHRKLRARSGTYLVKDGDSLQSIAKRDGMSWKTIAKLNKLKAPYHIEPGQKLRIPRRKS